MVCRPNSIENKNILKYPYHTGIKKCKFLVIDAWMVSRKDDTSTTLVMTKNEPAANSNVRLILIARSDLFKVMDSYRQIVHFFLKRKNLDQMFDQLMFSCICRSEAAARAPRSFLGGNSTKLRCECISWDENIIWWWFERWCLKSGRVPRYSCERGLMSWG